MDKLIPSFKESLFCDSFADGISDIAELGIDSVLSDGLLKDIPIFSLVLGISRTVKSVQERNFLKNTALFLDALNAKKIDTRKINQYKSKLQNAKYAEKELGRVIILLNQYIDNPKSQMLGKLFYEYVDQRFSWEEFCELSDILSRLFLEDFCYLPNIASSENGELEFHIYKIPYNIRRLEGIGLVMVHGEYKRFGDTLLQTENMYIELTSNGKIFVELGVGIFS